MKIFKRPNNDTYKALEPLYEVDVEITAEELAQIIADRIAANMPTKAQLIAATHVKAKTMLLQILPLLTSLQVDAQEDGTMVMWQGQSTALSTVIKQLKSSLATIPDMDLGPYQTIEEMEDAIQAAYSSLAVQAPAQVKSAFSALVPK